MPLRPIEGIRIHQKSSILVTNHIINLHNMLYITVRDLTVPQASFPPLNMSIAIWTISASILRIPGNTSG